MYPSSMRNGSLFIRLALSVLSSKHTNASETRDDQTYANEQIDVYVHVRRIENQANKVGNNENAPDYPND